MTGVQTCALPIFYFESLINNNNDSLKIENEQGVKGVDYISLIAPLVKSIQELTDKIELLETRLKG